ncbi:MAG: transglycosylase domain-containing protein [Actinomycetota bacterium]
MATKTLPRRNGRRHAPKKKKTSVRKSGKRHFLLRFWWLWAVPLAGAGVVFGALAYVYAQLPLNLNIEQEQTSYLYDQNGRLMTTFEAGVDRRAVDFKDMPEIFRQAVIAAEDEDFYSHGGVDLFAIVRAAWANFTGGEIEQGASTITQQYARNVFPEVGMEVSIERKIKEILYAIKLEQALPKDEILRRYLNTVYFGNGAYGVEAAAQTYFRAHAQDLTLAQSALLAGIVANPAAFDPVEDEDAAIGRRNYVLGRMVAAGFISEAQAEPLVDKPIVVERARPAWQHRHDAYYIDYARRYLEKNYGGRTFTGGLQVRGTLNPEWQEAAEQAIQTNLSLEPGTPQAALVAVDVRNGEVRAMVGGKNFSKEQVNLATGDGGTGRQSGSAFKPFTLMTAIDQGISLNSVFSGPAQVDLSDKGCPGWEPGNYSDSSAGTMNLVSATAGSVNTIFAQLVVEVGPENVAEVAHRMGIRSPLEIEGGAVPCSITLGTMEVTPLEMTEAFATFASLGVRHPATPVHVVKGPDGERLEKNTNKGREVFEENEALQAVYAMENVVCCGTGTVANDGLNFEVFGKTGTTDDDSDVWFCGASSEVAACVWVGHPSGRVPMPGATGGGVAAPIWNDFFLQIAKDIEGDPFPTPELTGEPLKTSPVPAPSPTGKVKEEEEEEEEPAEEPAPEPSPSAPPPPPPPPPPPSPTTPPPTTPAPTSPPPTP